MSTWLKHLPDAFPFKEDDYLIAVGVVVELNRGGGGGGGGGSGGGGGDNS